MSAAQITAVRVDIPAGRIEVVGIAGRDEVSVVVNPSNRLRAGDREAAENASVERAGDTVVVTVPVRSTMFGRPDSVDVIVEGPEGLGVDASTKYGEVRLTGVLGAARVAASYGAVKVERADSLEVSGGHGAVEVREVVGGASVTLSNGSVRAGRVGGSLAARSTNGSIKVEDVAGSARLETTNGSIQVERASGGVEARSTNGSIKVGSLSAGVSRFEATHGSVKVGVPRGTAVWLDATSSHGEVRTELDADHGPAEGESSVELHARTGFGSIRVYRAA
ncbi:DUF4097 family beta strand repeat-containing protein [Demequina sp. NBRC 110051]|uniref:DUF4097 family beta strand repeat-containing protein n=1 Tax=Demequina sp. NBRC 110051 TaxID=1570340 RepID=UPI0009FC222E|nr:DUF4097 family beta strand repeat-containing protein [Demequina sp. NBRC 110051]